MTERADFAATHQPCPCGKSSDAFSIREDGSGHCFSCGEEKGDVAEVVRTPRAKTKRPLLPPGDYLPLDERALHEETLRRYGTTLGRDEKGKRVLIFPYHDAGGKLVAQKVRGAGKTFSTRGDFQAVALFGQALWRKGGKRVVVTEGELDAMSVAQAGGLAWPVVSLPNGASSARKALEANLEWLESHGEVILWFDADAPGQEALQSVVDLFTPGKLKIVRVEGFKDANEMLQKGLRKEITNATWEAKEHRPDGIVNAADLWDLVNTPIKRGAAFPWKGLDDVLYGIHPRQIITLVAGTGSGKSELSRAIAYHLAINQGEQVGYIALEEGLDRSTMGFMGLHLGKRLWLPGVACTDAERRAAFDATAGSGRLWLFDHFGSLDSEHLMSKMRYLVKSRGVRYLFLDHLSIVVSGMDVEDNERRALDVIMTRLRSFTEETKASLILVSHLSRPKQGPGHEEGADISLAHLRGSAAIGQLSDVVLGAERDQQAEEEEDRLCTNLRVLKARMGGTTGIATTLRYDRDSGRFTEEGVGTPF